MWATAAATPPGALRSATVPTTVWTTVAALAVASAPFDPKIMPASCGARLSTRGIKRANILGSNGLQRGLAQAASFRCAGRAAVDLSGDEVDRPAVRQCVQLVGGPEPGGAVRGTGRCGSVRDGLIRGHVHRLGKTLIGGAAGDLQQATAAEPPAVAGGLVAVAHAVRVDAVGEAFRLQGTSLRRRDVGEAAWPHLAQARG